MQSTKHQFYYELVIHPVTCTFVLTSFYGLSYHTAFLFRQINMFDNECFINSQADCNGLWSDRNDSGKTAVLSLFNRLSLGKHYLISV